MAVTIELFAELNAAFLIASEQKCPLGKRLPVGLEWALGCRETVSILAFCV